MDNCRGDNKIKQEEQALNEEAIVIIKKRINFGYDGREAFGAILFPKV